MSTPTQTPNAFAMPLDQLATAAGITPGAPQVTPATPVPEPAPAAPAPPPAPAPTPVVPEPFQVLQGESGLVVQMSPEYGGEVFKGADWSEVGPKIAKAKADANLHIKNQKYQIQELQQQPTPQPSQPPPQPVDPQVQATRQWLASELAADPALAKAVVAAAFGLPNVEALDSRLGMVFQTTEKMSENVALAEFHKMCPAYVDTPENSQALGSYFPTGYRQPADPQAFAMDLKTAYALAVVDGKIAPQTTQAAAPAAPRPPVMPSAGATATSSATGDPWTMPLDQLAQLAGIK